LGTISEPLAPPPLCWPMVGGGPCLVTGPLGSGIIGCMRHFVDDDVGYREWLADHPSGFVINTGRNPTARYLMLHRANCWHARGPAHGEYSKVCGEREELEAFAGKLGGKVMLCGQCMRHHRPARQIAAPVHRTGSSATGRAPDAGETAEIGGHVFLSYVREDSAKVNRLQRLLEKAGVSVWRDTADLWPGEDWAAKIRHAITNDALVFIACFSSAGVTRKRSYQREEVLLAVQELRQRRPDEPWLIPVRFDACTLPDLDIGAGRTLASIHWVDLFGPQSGKSAARLVTAVQRILAAQSRHVEADGKPSLVGKPVDDRRKSDRLTTARTLRSRPQQPLSEEQGGSRSEQIDELLTDDAYLLYADLRRLMLAAHHATTRHARRGLQLLGLTPQAVTATSGERAALFSVTKALENLGADYAGTPGAPYLARWARTFAQGARTALEGHQGVVGAMCPVTVAGRELLAGASQDETVRIWDPTTGRQEAALEGRGGKIYAMCPVTVAGRELLASAGQDHTVRIWDPATGEQKAVLQGHRSFVDDICPVTVAGRELLASASEDGTVRIWDPATGEQEAVLRGHQSRVEDVCSLTVDEQQLLASASLDDTVRIWDPVTGRQEAVLQGQQGPGCLCPVTVAGRELLASAGVDWTVRIWDPATGRQKAVLEGHTADVEAVCPVTVAGRQLLASASLDGTVLIWDPDAVGQKVAPQGHRARVSAVCPVTVAGRQLLASASDDETVRIWETATGRPRATMRSRQGWLFAVCAITVAGRDLLASGGADGTVRIWDPATRRQKAVLQGHTLEVLSVCAVTVAGRQLLASSGTDGTVRIWDPTTGRQEAVLEACQEYAFSVCPVTVAGRQLLASSGIDGMVRIWDPTTGGQEAVLEGHQGQANGVCPVTVDGRDLLASASADRTVRIWDPSTGACLLTVPTHHEALAVAWVAESLAIGLTAGILVIKLNAAAL